MDREIRHLFIEIGKKGENYDATLSDDSIDRDGEFFGAELIKAWGSEKTTLPFLANHDNSMGSLVGGWTDRTVIEENGNFKLKMTPKFFSADANPLAQQIKRQIDEATDMGLRVGLSIGFIPIDGTPTARGYMHTQAELVEGSAVPVQSNRHASISLAKAFTFKGSDSNKRTSAELENGGTMPTLEELNKKMEDFAAENASLKSKVAELDAREPVLSDEEKKSIENSKKEIESIKAKAEENEKKIAAELETYAKKYEALKKEVEKPRGKIPFKQFAAQSKDQQNGAKPYNATEAYLKSKGLIENDEQ